MGVIMSVHSHTSVLLRETIDGLTVQPGGRYIDCTLGSGGHAAAILEKSSPGGQLLGIDADPAALQVARERLQEYSSSILLLNDNFVNLKSICAQYDFAPVHGILFDLGLSSLQLDGDERGFSFQHEAPLDMRFNPSQEVTAADIINTYPERELAQMIWTYGEEHHSRQIAHRIVQERPINTTSHLVRVIQQSTGGGRGRIHPATRTFQALRIAVNQELEHLESTLQQAVELLGAGGRMVVISYHSLEDRIVKQFMQREAKDCICPPATITCVCGHRASLRIITKKVIVPTLAEVQANPRSRSARLRAAERIIAPDLSHNSAEKLNHSPPALRPYRSNLALTVMVRETFSPLEFNSFDTVLWGG